MECIQTPYLTIPIDGDHVLGGIGARYTLMRETGQRDHTLAVGVVSIQTSHTVAFQGLGQQVQPGSVPI